MGMTPFEDQRNQARFKLVMMFLNLLFYGIELLLGNNMLLHHWIKDREKLYKELSKYERNYVR